MSPPDSTIAARTSPRVEGYGIGGRAGAEPSVLAKFGTSVIDLHQLEVMGLLDVHLADFGGAGSVFRSGSLNAFMELGSATWRAVDEQLGEVLATGVPPDALAPVNEMRLSLPIEVADFCDFYASEYHASNMGRILRPGGEALPAAWRRIPLGYHGRAGTVVVSGTAIRRPMGVVASPDGPVYRPSARLDLEVELGYVIGNGSSHGTPVGVEDALDHVFGVVVLNDWSARDVQAFEYQPLGPFLGKSFATSISAWVVPMRALAELRVNGPDQGEEVGPHLACRQPRAFDIALELSVNSTVLSCTNARHLHWSVEQLVAHLTSNGASLRTGDLIGTGTISGPDPGTLGSLMELSWGGERPIVLADGTERTWLEDGDTTTIRAWLRDTDDRGDRGNQNIALGEVTGRILASTPGS